MGRNRNYFNGKRVEDLDIMLEKAGDASILVRKWGKIESTLADTKMDAINYNFSDHKYKFTTVAGGVPYYISSSDATANQLVTVTLLNNLGEQVVIPVILNGQNPVQIIDTVSTKNPNSYFTRHQTSSLFTLKTNKIAGNVYISESSTNTAGVPPQDSVRGFIAEGENRTQQCIFTIPLGYRGFFVDTFLYFTKKQDATAVYSSAFSLPFGNNTPLDLTDWPANQSDPLLVANAFLTTGKPDLRREFDFSNVVHSGDDIVFSFTSDTAGAGVAAEFDILLIKNEFFGI